MTLLVERILFLTLSRHSLRELHPKITEEVEGLSVLPLTFHRPQQMNR